MDSDYYAVEDEGTSVSVPASRLRRGHVDLLGPRFTRDLAKRFDAPTAVSRVGDLARLNHIATERTT
jgi:hypothetical protein